MQIALHIRRQAIEPTRRAARCELGCEGGGVGGVVEDGGEEARGRGGDEDGEDGGGGEFGGQSLGERAEREEEGGVVGWEGGYACEGGAGWEWLVSGWEREGDGMGWDGMGWGGGTVGGAGRRSIGALLARRHGALR